MYVCLVSVQESMKEKLNELLAPLPGQREAGTEAGRLTWSSLTIMKHRSLSNPFRPKVPKVVWISEKRRLLVTSWWVFISYQVFSWSMWHVILKEKQTLKTQKQLRMSSSWGDVGRNRVWASAVRNDGYVVCLITSASRQCPTARKAKFSEITFSCPMAGHRFVSLISTESGCCLELSREDEVGFGCQAGRRESPVFSPQDLS